jgi:hypothetical protein
MTTWKLFHSAVLLALACVDIAILVAMFHPAVKNKAGPTWIWALWKYDPIRNILFKSDGSFREYGRVFLSIVLIAALVLILYIMVSLWM